MPRSGRRQECWTHSPQTLRTLRIKQLDAGAEQTALGSTQTRACDAASNCVSSGEITHVNNLHHSNTRGNTPSSSAAYGERTIYSCPPDIQAPSGAYGYYWSLNAQTNKTVRTWMLRSSSQVNPPSGIGSSRTHSRAERRRHARSQQAAQTTLADTHTLRRTVSNTTPERPLWLGPYRDSPPYLDGSLVGDYGWDSSGLSSTPERLASNRSLELIHARWAMLGSLGCLTPELLSSFSSVTFRESTWFTAGSQILSSTGLDYLGNPALIHAQRILAVLFLQILLIGLAEGYRVAGGPLGESAGLYPGNSLDPLGLGEDSSTLSELQLKELKNGRLAMVSILGMYTQALTTGKGPVANWQEHIANPTTINGFSYATKLSPTLLS